MHPTQATIKKGTAGLCTLSVQKRAPHSTRGQIRQLRKDGSIPAVLYGGEQSVDNVSVYTKEFLLELKKPGIYSRVFSLGEGQLAIIKDIQFEPVYGKPLHVDFYRLSADSRVTLPIHLRFMNEEACVGIKRGGVLNVIHHKLDISVLADNIPEEIEIDVSSLDIGQAVHAQDLNLPSHFRVLNVSAQEALVSIVPPAGKEAEGKSETA